MSYTKEPWRVGTKGMEAGKIIAGINDDLKVVAETNYNFPECAVSDARRIVACVNACEGVTNGELALTNLHVVMDLLKDTEQQRDELLAMLKEVLDKLNFGLYSPALVPQVRELIARIEGNSNITNS